MPQPNNNKKEDIKVALHFNPENQNAAYEKEEKEAPLVSCSGIPSGQQRLIFPNDILEDKKPLKHYNIEHRNTPHLISKLQNPNDNIVPRNNKVKKQNNCALNGCCAAMFGWIGPKTSWIGPKTKSAAGAVVVASSSGYIAATVKTSVTTASSVKFASLSTFLGFSGTCAGALLMGAGAAFGLAIAAAWYKEYLLSIGLSLAGIGYGVLTATTLFTLGNIWNPIGWTLIGIGGIIAVGALIKKWYSKNKSSKNKSSKDLGSRIFTSGQEEFILNAGLNLDLARDEPNIVGKHKTLGEHREHVQTQIEFLRYRKKLNLNEKEQLAYTELIKPFGGFFDSEHGSPSVFNPDEIQKQKNAIATIKNWGNTNRSSETKEVKELDTRLNDYEDALTSIEDQYNQFKNQFFKESDSYQDIRDKLVEFNYNLENEEYYSVPGNAPS
ncbi:MAG: hypothetical protein GY782_06310 [Gammaproteobacteria bacterium]|nr:hypothetical protein [Gammaproteobacteria bacterium]